MRNGYFGEFSATYGIAICDSVSCSVVDLRGHLDLQTGVTMVANASFIKQTWRLSFQYYGSSQFENRAASRIANPYVGNGKLKGRFYRRVHSLFTAAWRGMKEKRTFKTNPRINKGSRTTPPKLFSPANMKAGQIYGRKEI